MPPANNGLLKSESAPRNEVIDVDAPGGIEPEGTSVMVS
jgi:hypothetical protein